MVNDTPKIEASVAPYQAGIHHLGSQDVQDLVYTRRASSPALRDGVSSRAACQAPPMGPSWRATAGDAPLPSTRLESVVHGGLRGRPRAQRPVAPGHPSLGADCYTGTHPRARGHDGNGSCHGSLSNSDASAAAGVVPEGLSLLPGGYSGRYISSRLAGRGAISGDVWRHARPCEMGISLFMPQCASASALPEITIHTAHSTYIEMENNLGRWPVRHVCIYLLCPKTVGQSGQSPTGQRSSRGPCPSSPRHSWDG